MDARAAGGQPPEAGGEVNAGDWHGICHTAGTSLQPLPKAVFVTPIIYIMSSRLEEELPHGTRPRFRLSGAAHVVPQAGNGEFQQPPSGRLHQAGVDQAGAVVADGVLLVPEPLAMARRKSRSLSEAVDRAAPMTTRVFLRWAAAREISTDWFVSGASVASAS